MENSLLMISAVLPGSMTTMHPGMGERRARFLLCGEFDLARALVGDVILPCQHWCFPIDRFWAVMVTTRKGFLSLNKLGMPCLFFEEILTKSNQVVGRFPFPCWGKKVLTFNEVHDGAKNDSEGNLQTAWSTSESIVGDCDIGNWNGF